MDSTAREWTPLPAGVTWKSPWLGSLCRSRRWLEARFGPPQLRDLDSNGLGPFDCWTLRFRCGVEVALWRYRYRPDGTDIDDPDEPSHIDIHASERDKDHLRVHLGVEADAPDLYWSADAVEAPRAFAVRRQDDNGNGYEVTVTTSRCEAEAIAARFAARGHKQWYWVEGLQR